MLEMILLGYLNYGPFSGYELKTTMDDSTNHFWHAYHSQIYTTLRRLEADGLVISDEVEEPGRLNPRIYHITDQGRDHLHQWLDKPMTELPSIKDDFLVRMYFSARRDPQLVMDELRFQRRLHVEKLAHYHEIDAGFTPAQCPPELYPDQRFWRLTLQMGIGHEQMYIAWLDQAIQMMAE
jgi:DNA-binding PadR family transcriptional regulator